jgi:murein DD-endopeptidase MepM/ murein hydrolase activator NlpD
LEERYVTLGSGRLGSEPKKKKKLETLWQTVSSRKLWQGGFLKPVASDLSSGFGRRRIVNGKPRSPHSGVDLKAATGTSIVAANSGRIVLADDLFFSGKTVVLDHGLGLYLYGHCSKLVASQDEIVKKGEVSRSWIHRSSHRATPSLACRMNGARVDPTKLTGGLLGD